MWIFMAPHPMTDIVTIMPSAELGDLEQQRHQVQLKRMTDGTHKTHIIINDGRLYSWLFIVTRMKALEFKALYQLYAGEPWKVITHDDTEIVGTVHVNPLNLEQIGRGVVADSHEQVLLKLDFEATE